MNALFYGRNCQASLALIKLLTEDKLIGNIKLFCVEDWLKSGKPLPPHITQVPTLILSNLPKPLVAKAAIGYVYQRRQMLQQQSNELLETRQRLIQQNNIMKSITQHPLPYIPTEMSGFSDNFAYTNEQIKFSPPRTFFGYGDEEKHAIYTAPEGKELNSIEHRDKTNQILSKRTEQDKENESVIKQSQVVAIINAEKKKLLSKYNK